MIFLFSFALFVILKPVSILGVIFASIPSVLFESETLIKESELST